jgi:ribonuclease VapC
MVIDTSAILALLKEESEQPRIIRTIAAHPVRYISSVSILEAHIVISSREHPDLLEAFYKFLREINVIIMPFDEHQSALAIDAFRKFGKGRGNPAQLNMGDCAVYALAKATNEPLLFVGNDFSRTDIQIC